MTIAEAKARQKEVEELIKSLLDEYEKLAECEVISVSLKRFDRHFNYGDRIRSVALDVRLKSVDRGDGAFDPENRRRRYLWGDWKFA